MSSTRNNSNEREKLKDVCRMASQELAWLLYDFREYGDLSFFKVNRYSHAPAAPHARKERMDPLNTTLVFTVHLMLPEHATGNPAYNLMQALTKYQDDNLQQTMTDAYSPLQGTSIYRFSLTPTNASKILKEVKEYQIPAPTKDYFLAKIRFELDSQKNYFSKAASTFFVTHNPAHISQLIKVLDNSRLDTETSFKKIAKIIDDTKRGYGNIDRKTGVEDFYEDLRDQLEAIRKDASQASPSSSNDTELKPMKPTFK